MGEGDALLLERDRELERIGECLQRARQGRGGALVVEGQAGIGKTALLAVARRTAEGEGFGVLRARGAELEREFAFGVVRQLFESVVAGASEEERSQLLDGPPGVAARLLGLPGLGDTIATAAPIAPDPSFAVLHGLYWLCANLSAERPLALVVDDAHWADGASLRFLAFLLPRLEELHVAVLLAARPAEAGESRELLAALTMDSATEVVTVGPLTTRGVATMMAVALGVEPEPEFAAACWEATGGTPFLVRTLVEALLDEQIAPVAASAAKVRDVATGTLSRWAMLRLARLGPDAASMARAVAVLERAELDQAARLSGLALTDAALAADLLVGAGVLDEAPLCFAHPLLRGAVYRDMAASDRVEAHGRSARLLAEAHANPARVAEHLLATVPTGDSWTVEQLRAAAWEATARGAPESAVAYLSRALSEPPSPEAGAGLLLELGLAEFSAGQPGWHDQLAEAVESAGSDTTRVAAALLFTNALRWHERAAEAIEVCDGVAARLDASDAEGRLTLEAMAVACGMLDAATAPLVADRVGALLVAASNRSVPRQCLAAAAYVAALANQPADQVADLALRAIAADARPPLEQGDTPWLPGGAFRHPSAVVTLLWAERYDEAQALADAAVAEAQASANAMMLPAVLAQRAWLAFRRSDLTAAEADARALLDAPGPPAPPLLRNRATSVLVDVLVERGDLDEAERTLEPLAVDLPGTGQTAAILRHARGRLRFAQRRFGEALGDLRAAGEISTGGLARTLATCRGARRRPWLRWLLVNTTRRDASATRRSSCPRLRCQAHPRRGSAGRRARSRRSTWRGSTARGDRGARRSRYPPRARPHPGRSRRPAPSQQPPSRGRVNFSAKQSTSPTTSAPKRSPYGPRPSCALPAPGRAGCCLPGLKRSPRVSVASPNWPPKGLQTARSPKPCSLLRGRSRATSPMCSTSST